MYKLILSVMAGVFLSACAGDDSGDDDGVVAPESPGATSLEDCSNVSLSTTRINAAARTTLNTELIFSNALAVWRMPVTAGQDLEADMTVPDDKDYNMAFFDGSGNKLACAYTVGKGVDEAIDYTVASGISEIWVKVWTPELASRSNFTLTVAAPVLVTINDTEPNDTPETAQVITDVWTTVDGSLDTDNSDADDYYKYSVSEGDVVTVTGTAVDDGASLIYVAIAGSDGNVVEVGSNALSHYYSESEPDASLSYTVPSGVSTVYIWMAAQPGTATYTTTVKIR